MSQRTINQAVQMYAAGANIGRIARALNCTVMAVAHALTQKGVA